jgi:hypothetical protein
VKPARLGYTGTAAASEKAALCISRRWQVAGGVVAGEDVAHFRLLSRAALEGVGQRVWAAARGRVDRARHVAFEDDALAGRLGVGDRDSRRERPGVGVLGG